MQANTKRTVGEQRARVAADGGWTAEGTHDVVDALGRELVAAALVASGRAELRTVWLFVEHRGETVRVDLDHARRVARIDLVDDGVQLVGIARAA